MGSSESLIAQVTPAPLLQSPQPDCLPRTRAVCSRRAPRDPRGPEGRGRGGQQSARSAVTSPRPDQESNPSPSTPPPSQNMNIQVEDIRIRAILSAYRRRTPVTEGYVEVKEGKTWKQICDRHWTAKNSRVVCGMFGFPGEKSYNAKVYTSKEAAGSAAGWALALPCCRVSSAVAWAAAVSPAGDYSEQSGPCSNC